MGKIVLIGDSEDFLFEAAAASMDDLCRRWLTSYNILSAGADNKELLIAVRSSALVIILPSAHPHRFPNEPKQKTVLNEIFEKQVPCIVIFETQSERSRFARLFRENKHTFFSPANFTYDGAIANFLSHEAATYWERHRAMIQKFDEAGLLSILHSGKERKPRPPRTKNNHPGSIAHIFASAALNFHQ